MTKRMALSLVFLLTLALGAQAGPFSQMVIFGDSFSDTGNAYIGTNKAIPPSPPYFPGVFSDGPNWVQYTAAGLGVTANPFLLGGTNFAIGGAETGFGGSIPGTGVLGQLIFWFLSSSIDPSALYVLAAGANDIRNAAYATNDPAALYQAGQGAAQALLGYGQTLATFGARNLLFMTLPDVGFVPEMVGAGKTTQASTATKGFNDVMYAAKAAHKASWKFNLLDFRLLGEQIALDGLFNNGATYGINNVVYPCLFIPGACGNSFFFDNLHPTSRVHQLLAQRALDLLNPPTLISSSSTSAAVPEPAHFGLVALALGAGAVLRRRA